MQNALGSANASPAAVIAARNCPSAFLPMLCNFSNSASVMPLELLDSSVGKGAFGWVADVHSSTALIFASASAKLISKLMATSVTTI